MENPKKLNEKILYMAYQGEHKEWSRLADKYEVRQYVKSKGLENILAVCPRCKEKHTITTKKDKVFCQHCGYLTSLDQRYNFTEDVGFQNLGQWYQWQMKLLEKEIAKLEKQAWNEKQPRKKIEMTLKLKELQNELEGYICQ